MGPTSDGNFEEFESLLSEDFGVQPVAVTSANNMTDLSTNIQPKRTGLNGSLVALTFLSGIGGFLFGYDTGVVSGAMLLIEDDPRINPNTTWKELIVTSTVAFAWAFSLIAGPVSERFGRKPTILTASVVFTAGAAVMGVAISKEVLMIGRALVGAGIGFASMVVPMYISESAPSEYRGTLVVCNNLMITFGQFVAGCVCGAFSGINPNGWKWMLGLAGVPSAVQFLGFLFMPESPRWLISKGLMDEARKVLQKTMAFNETELERQVALMQQAIRTETENTADPDSTSGSSANSLTVLKRVLKTPSTRRALGLGCLLQLFQQFAGINTVMYYSAKIITMAGISNKTLAIWLSAAVASMNFLWTLPGMLLVERAGRRKLLLCSLLGVALSLLVLGVGFQVANMDTPSVDTWPLDNPDCGAYKDCGSCTFDTACGYCYQLPAKGSSDIASKGSCVPISQDSEEFAQLGRCAKNSTTVGMNFAPDYCPSPYAWVIIVGLCLYLFAFAPGMGCIPWTVNSEIYPTWARSTCQSIATSTNWAGNILVSMTFLSLTELITKQGTFYLYTGIAVMAFIVFYLILPETKGKTMEEMDKLFRTTGSSQQRRS